jgi:two-component system response regulator YesN
VEEAPQAPYTLIFVDDEDIVRQGITSRIPWGENGFQLAGVFENGRSALEYLKHHEVDVVLSDISMPQMDGLTLSKEIAAAYPRTQVLLLTGFEEFEYAQEAVRHRVKEFLLKPITAEELGEVLSRNRLELDRLRTAEKEQERLKDLLERSLPLLKERFFYRLASGRLSTEEITRRRDFFGWQDKGAYYQIVMAVRPDEWEEITRLAFSESAKQLINDGDVIFANRNEDLVLLLQDSSVEALIGRSREIAEKLFSAALKIGDAPLTVGIGEAVGRLDDVNRSYLGAGNAIDHARVTGITRVLSINEVRKKTRVSQEAFVSRARRLVTALREGTRHSARDALDEIFTLFEESYLTSSDVVNFLARLQYHLSDFVDEMGLGTSDGTLDLSLTAEPRKFARLDGAKRYYQDQVDKIEELVGQRRHDAAHSRIDKARRIIAERYTDKNFSLQDICADLYLSTSQFSALFKEGTGHTFVEYLTEVRIDQAKHFLKTTDLKSYEIADRVGYQDPRYFSSIFKKVTGFTTTEYRKEMES